MCLVDIATTHTIHYNKKNFISLIIFEVKLNTILGPADLIEGFGRAMFTLASGIELCIHDALYSPKSRRNILSFKDILRNKFI